MSPMNQIRTKLTLLDTNDKQVFAVDSDNRFGVVDQLAEYLRFVNTDISEFSISIHEYANT